MSFTKGVKGHVAGQHQTPVAGSSMGLSTVDDDAASAQQLYMQQGKPFLCLGPDGQQALFVYDNERSIPGVSRVLKRIYPPA